MYRGERRNDRKDDRVIENACIDSFEEERRFIVLSGTGGMGKSMMMTHFMLDTIDKNKETGEVPVFVLLRDYNPEAGDLIDFIFGELKRHDVDLIYQIWWNCCRAARVLFCLMVWMRLRVRTADGSIRKWRTWQTVIRKLLILFHQDRL